MKKKLFIVMVIVISLVVGCGQKPTSKEADKKVEKGSIKNTVLPEEKFINDLKTSLNSRTYDLKIEKLDKDVLKKTLWEYNNEYSKGTYIMFYDDNQFYMGTKDGEVWATYGSYKIMNDTQVKLYNFNSPLKVKGLDPNAPELLMSLFKDETNFYYTDLLVTDNKKAYFASVDSKTLAGGVYMLNNIEVIKEEWDGVTIDRVKFRDNPSLEGNTINIPYSEYKSGTTDKTYFLKGMKLQILAKTKAKQKIQNWDNHWYYIKCDLYGDELIGWVYGEFIETYDKDKVDGYKATLDKEYSTITAE